jgi:medium-chain acyl-[acyl-carrier-protein] hydrolase
MQSQKSKCAVNPWVVWPRRHPQARVRLFCFPYSGAGASIYFQWPDSLLPVGVETCAIQLPGRGTRLIEPPLTNLEPLVQALSHALIPFLDEPFAFFGHSMGALLGFELARHLREHYGLCPMHLFVSGHEAPHLRHSVQAFHEMADLDLIAELRRLNGMPDEVLQNGELMALLLPALRADFTLCETYVYRPGDALDCPISAYGGLQDTEVSREQLAAWREMTNGQFCLRMFPGDHFYVHSQRPLLLQTLAGEIMRSGQTFLDAREPAFGPSQVLGKNR